MSTQPQDPEPAWEGTPPPWLEEGGRLAWCEAVLFTQTLLRAVFQPFRLGEGWATRKVRALSPLGFVATLASLVALARLVLLGASSSNDSPVAAAVVPYLHYLALGVLAHGALRLMGSRQRLSASIGGALFSGGAALLHTILVYTISRWAVMETGIHTGVVDDAFAALPHGTRRLFFGLMQAGFVWLMFNLTWLLAGIHRMGRAKALAAVCVAIAIMAFIYGVARPPSALGAHLAFLRWGGRWIITFRF